MQLDSVRKDTHAVSVTGPIVDRKDNRLTQTDGKKPSKGSGRRGESPTGTGGRIACRYFFWGKCSNPWRKNWHPPVCLNYKSESACTHGDKCRFRHVEANRQPSKKQKKSGGKRNSCLTNGVFIHLGCVSQDSHPRKSILREVGRLDQFTESNSRRARCVTYKFGKESIHRKD